MSRDLNSEYERLRSEYFQQFGEPFLMGYGVPESEEKCIAIIHDCIDNDRPFDPYAYNGVSEDTIF